MNFDVSVNGKPWKVAIEAAGQPGRYTVTVKGKRREMDAAGIDADTLSLIDTQSGATREIGLTRLGVAVDVAVGGKTFRAVAEKRGLAEKRGQTPLSVRGTRPQGSDPVSPGVPFSQDGRVTSPMPGRAVRVLVAIGDKVTAGQAVVVVEAMKMENELRSPKDGTVTQVLVQEGAAIESGAVLVVVE